MPSAHGQHGVSPKPGDWHCPGCGDLQFAKNLMCRKCGTPNPAKGHGAYGGIPPHMMGHLQMWQSMFMNMAAQMAGGMKAGGVPSFPIVPNMKPGDWLCASCGDHQFANNTHCRKCGAAQPGMNLPAKKPGDWNCPSCKDFQFAKNTVCRKCQTPNPDVEGSLAAKEAGMQSLQNLEKPGDWYCPKCNDLQFARNASCRKCGADNPDYEGSQALAASISQSSTQEMKEGDWNCPNCQDHQFAKNLMCRKCGTARPGGAGVGFGAHMSKMMVPMKAMGKGMVMTKGGCLTRPMGVVNTTVIKKPSFGKGFNR